MNDDEITTLDWHRGSLLERAKPGHIHDLDGTCRKRRAGPLCTPTSIAHEADDD